MKTEEMNEKLRKNQGVHLQNYLVKCPIVPNLILSQCMDKTCLPK